MAHNHIGIPKFIQKGFSDNGRVYVYDLIRDIEYKTSIDTLGTQNNYYDDVVEKEILSSGVETQFGSFYHDFCEAKNLEDMKSMLDTNTNLVERFFSFMFLRSKKSLESINSESITSKVFGFLSHSDLLKIQMCINVNPLKIIGDKYKFYPLVNHSKTEFINNSIGFGLMINKINERTFVIPLNTKVAILISNVVEIEKNDFLCIEPKDYEKADKINKSISKMEKEYGNGFIFGREKDLVCKYKDFIAETYK